jgi:osmotically-inducible protein OsmY
MPSMNNRTINRITLISTLVFTLTGCFQETVPPVAAGSWFNHDRRTARTIMDDQAITIKANLAIAKNKKVWKESHISTLSYNNALLLVGQTETQANKHEIEKMLEPIGEIGNIYNQITVGETIPLKVRANDTWITTQVKAKLIGNTDVGINRVKVLTEDGTVYLMGKLTVDEENIALDMARRIKGVKKVVAVIEKADIE